MTHKSEETNYDAESPDELALVKAADAYGFSLMSRSSNEIRLRLPSSAPSTGDSGRHGIHEDEVDVEVLKVLPFDSDRKRMSIVVRFEERLLLFTKGADEQILPNLNFYESTDLIEHTKKILEDYGKIGLRTLCMAMRELDEHEYADWLQTREFVESIDASEQDEMLSESSKTLEVDLHLLGVTAIEDRLQNGVTDTIESLRKAGIQIWVLTGDKCETAVNIAKSCHLFSRELEIRIFHSLEDLKNFDGSRKINAVFSSEIVRLIKEKHEESFRVIEQ